MSLRPFQKQPVATRHTWGFTFTTGNQCPALNIPYTGQHDGFMVGGILTWYLRRTKAKVFLNTEVLSPLRTWFQCATRWSKWVKSHSDQGEANSISLILKVEDEKVLWRRAAGGRDIVESTLRSRPTSSSSSWVLSLWLFRGLILVSEDNEDRWELTLRGKSIIYKESASEETQGQRIVPLQAGNRLLLEA